MITLLLVIAGAIVVSAARALLVNLANSPEGYEDATGFHVVAEQKTVRKARVAKETVLVHDTATAVNVHLRVV